MSTSYRQLIGLALIAIAGLVAWLVVWPMWSNLQQSRALLADARVRLADKHELIERIAERKREFEANRAEAERAGLVIPVGRDVPGVLETASALATVSGVSLDTLGLNAGSGGQAAVIEGTTLSTISVSLGASGSYDAIKTLLKNIEQNIRLLETAGMDFSKRDAEGGAPDAFSVTLQMNAYYQ